MVLSLLLVESGCGCIGEAESDREDTAFPSVDLFDEAVMGRRFTMKRLRYRLRVSREYYMQVLFRSIPRPIVTLSSRRTATGWLVENCL